jgi:hypothetical protein
LVGVGEALEQTAKTSTTQLTIERATDTFSVIGRHITGSHNGLTHDLLRFPAVTIIVEGTALGVA